MALYTTVVTPFRAITNNTSRQVRVFRLNYGHNSPIARHSDIKEKQESPIAAYCGCYVKDKESDSPTSSKKVPVAAYWRYYVEADDSTISSKGSSAAAYWRYVEDKESSNPTLSKDFPIASYKTYFAQTKEPGSPAPIKKEAVTTSGGGETSNESVGELFHKALNEIKQLWKDKTMTKRPKTSK